MKVESTSYLKIRFDWLFSIYVVFAVAVSSATSGSCRTCCAARTPEAVDPTKVSSGL